MQIYLQYFGNLSATIDDQPYDLQRLLGRQLTTVFAMLVFYRKTGVSKNRFIETFWSNSENPSNALKFSIHRLRQVFKTIEPLKDVEVVVTTKNGYMINKEIDISTDFELFEKYGQMALNNNNTSYYEKALALYREDFLISFNDIDKILLDRAHYKVLMARLAESYCALLDTHNTYSVMVQVAANALRFDELNEELIYYYIKALLETKQFNCALTYYETISTRMHKEMGVELQSKISQLLNIVSSQQKESSSDEISFSSSLVSNQGETLKGPLYCDYASFKKIAQFEIRNSIRLKTKKFLLFVSFKDRTAIDNDILGLVRMVAHTLRINDVYTRVSNSQVVILCSFNDKSDGYIVAERIINAYYHKISKRSELTYSLVDLLPQHINSDIVNIA